MPSEKPTVQPLNLNNLKPPGHNPTAHHIRSNPKVYVDPVHPLFGTFLTFSLGLALYAAAPNESDPRDVIAVLSMLGNILWISAGLSLLFYPRFFRCEDKTTMWACYFFEIVKLTAIATKVLIAAAVGHSLSLEIIRNSAAYLISNIWTFVGGISLLYITFTFYIYAMVSIYLDILAFYHLVGDKATAGWSNTHAQLERNLRAIIPFSTRMYTRAKKAEDKLNEADRVCTLICPCSCHQSTKSEASQIEITVPDVENEKDRVLTDGEILSSSNIQDEENIDRGTSNLNQGWEGRIHDCESIAEDTEGKDTLVTD